MPMEIHTDLAARVLALPGSLKIVAIDGPSGAGKSTFAACLAEAASGAPVIGSDQFPVPWDGDPLAWWPAAARLLTDLPQSYEPYDWRTGTYGPAIEIPVVPLLIVEGVGAAWRGCPADFRVWVDAPYAVRRERALRRDGAALLPPWEEWAERESAHFAADGTRARCDLITGGWQRPPPVRP